MGAIGMAARFISSARKQIVIGGKRRFPRTSNAIYAKHNCSEKEGGTSYDFGSMTFKKISRYACAWLEEQ